MEIKFDVYFKKNLGTLFKNNEVDLNGLPARTNLQLVLVDRLEINYKVGSNKYTDIVTITDATENLIQIPFKSDVMKVGLNEFEIVAYMKNGDVKTSQTYTYNIDEAIGEGKQTGSGGSSDGHTHSNLNILNSITQTKVNEWNNKADATHSHSEYASKSHNHNEYANITHTHSNYASATHSHGEYASKNHTHNASEIVDLVLPTVPTKTSQLQNDSDFATNASVDEKIANVSTGGQIDLTSYAKKTDLPTKVSQLENDSNFISSIPEEYVTEQELNAKGLATETFVTNKIAEASIGGGSQTIIFEDILDGEIFKASIACQSISLSPNELTISDMQPQTIVANISPDDCTDEIVWSVEPSGVATVTNGVVTPIAKGSCIVTATCGSKSATCNVTIEEYVLCTGVTLSADRLSFNTSDTQTLTATIQPSNCMQEVIWNIQPSGIVNVENNIVTPLSNGNCTITVTCGNYSDSCTINVSCFETMYSITNNLTKATSNNSAATIAEGTTYSATITADPDCEINSCTVMMGGVDITNTAYVNGVITIENVSGDIVITVVAVSTVAPASTQVMKFVKNDDGTMYYEWDRAKMIEVENYGGNSKKLINTANAYTNETYSMHSLANEFVSDGVSLNDVDLWKYIPQAKVVETSQANALTDTSTTLADNEFYVCNYGSSSKAQYSVRAPIASTADTSANTWLLNLIEQDTIKLPVTTEPTVQYTVNPEYLTNIIIKTHEKDSTIQYAQFANSDPNKPTDNIYSGFNTLFGTTASNANLSQASAGIAAMSTTVVSIAFYPGTFEEFTLDNVKAYLTEHPLTFYKL